jgi:hypothetical protein
MDLLQRPDLPFLDQAVQLGDCDPVLIFGFASMSPGSLGPHPDPDHCPYQGGQNPLQKPPWPPMPGSLGLRVLLLYPCHPPFGVFLEKSLPFLKLLLPEEGSYG